MDTVMDALMFLPLVNTLLIVLIGWKCRSVLLSRKGDRHDTSDKGGR